MQKVIPRRSHPQKLDACDQQTEGVAMIAGVGDMCPVKPAIRPHDPDDSRSYKPLDVDW